MSLESKLNTILAQQKQILSLLNPQNKPAQLVRMKTAMKETGRSKTWITEQRIADKSIAILEGGIYKYDLVRLKSLAA